MGWKEKGIDDARKGSKYDEPSRDLVDRVSGFTSKDEDQWKKDYGKGYEIGTHQRVADSNSDDSSSSSGGSGK